MKSGAELLVDALAHQGVETIFGFPGDTSIAFYDVLGRTPAIRHVLARDERHAAFMADAHTRSTGRIGVCEASSGAGAVYLASGLGEARASSIPLLAITTDNSTRSAGTAPISEQDQELLFAACTKWHRLATSIDEIPGLVTEAFEAAVEGRPGPVALILPEDLLEATTSADPGTPVTGSAARTPGRRVAVSTAVIDDAAAQLVAAERPVILAGGGIHLSAAWQELEQFAHHCGVPVATSIHGKGAIGESHPLALGVVGSNGARDYANAGVAAADLVLFIGTRANATDTLSFTAPARTGTRILHIETDPARAGRNYPGSVALIGDARTVLEQLRAQIPEVSKGVRDRRIAEIAAARRDWVRQDSETGVSLPDGVLHPRDVIRVLADTFGQDVWVVADAGTPTPYLSCYWQAPGDGWRVIIPRGHGPMGFAIPASIGVGVGRAGDRVLCLTTENSVAMAVAEWETAARLGLPITYVVLDNTSMAWIKMIQHLYAGGRYFAVDPGPIDPVLLAEGMGVPGAKATSLDQLATLAKEAAVAAGPAVIHVAVPEHMDVPPPVPTWHAALTGQTAGRPIH
ncbi:thiamine pyrophosphate-binding protein [Myceligenerans crystallogenes]|uniref:Thiamine pyrophosphate-binding protein n=1 Tax=Myceligenerans crystallogenes TaxID=316335 RepID=A0ABP4ZT40_9MICO